MTHAFADSSTSYDSLYVEDAMHNLGEFFDYGINDYGCEGDELMDLFARSRTGTFFGKGEARLVAGKSGVELFMELACELGYADSSFPEASFHMHATPQSWMGWVCAYAQWRLAVPFSTLFSVLPYNDLEALYNPLHEASEERFVRMVIKRLDTRELETNLARLRKAAFLTQRQLSEKAGISARTVQMLEQRNKNINHARIDTLLRLAHALHCTVDTLLEPADAALERLDVA